MQNVQERYASGNMTPPPLSPQIRADQSRTAPPHEAMFGNSDAIRRIGPQYRLSPNEALPPGLGGFGGGTPVQGGGIVQQLLNIIQELLSMLGLGGLSGFGNIFGGLPGGETLFQNASGASVGDPHLSFDGTDATGANQQTHFDSMTGHDDLLDSDSFAGGYQLSTAATQPAANGVTYNQRATISTAYGGTQVSLDNGGNATIVRNGQTTSLADGQSICLGDGETVTRAANGSVVVTDDNGLGGNITTTLSVNGQGVDIHTQASDVDLGGDLLNQPQGTGTPFPIWHPLQPYTAGL